MTSILTNTSAMAALQTLRGVNAGLDKSQQQISSGLRVQKASDNAAYWSIATTMRSDAKAVSAVSDALGLGAAKVDTAYSAMESTVDVLSAFRAKLVAATEKGIDKSKIQDELEQLKGQLLSTAMSAGFNGVNWLNTSEPNNLAEISSLPDYVTSSFIRSSNGSVSVGQTKVELSDISLFNAGGGGALQKDIRSLGDIGGFRYANLTTSSFRGHQSWTMTGPITLVGTDSISFDLSIDGNSPNTVTINKATIDTALGTTNGVIGDSVAYTIVLNQALADAGLSSFAIAPLDAYATPLGPRVAILSLEQTGNDASSISVTNVQQLPSGNAGGLAGTPISIGPGAVYLASAPGAYASSQFAFTSPFQVYRDVSFSFDLSIDGTTAHTITVDRDLVDSVLGTSDGWINSAADLANVLSAAANGTGVNISESSGNVVFAIDSSIYPQMGARSRLTFGNITDNIGPVPDFDIVDVDITDPTKSLSNYLTGVEIMLQKVISGASVLGSVKTRVELQSQFASNMLDNIDKGVGRLVDTDMEEASAKLTAQQTQQQLAIQSLQIANSSAQTILSLFQ